MKSELLKIGPFTVHGYGLMIAIGVIAAYSVLEYRGKKKGLESDFVFSLTLWCTVGGILSARILYYITEINNIIENPKLLINFSQGFVVYGGIIGGILSGYLCCRVKKVEFWQVFDLTMPSIALAQGFGRIGCFLAGCCYGRETTSRISIVFTNSNLAPNGVHLIPTQLISSGLNFLHFIVLVLIARKVKIKGVVAGCYLVFYSIGRFIIEFYRGDLERGTVGILSTSQFISIFIVIIGMILIIVKTVEYKHSKRD